MSFFGCCAGEEYVVRSFEVNREPLIAVIVVAASLLFSQVGSLRKTTTLSHQPSHQSLSMKTAFVLFSVSSVATAFVAPGALTRLPTGLWKTETATEEATAVGAAAISALTKDVKTVFNTEEIDKLLPHRYPFALVDKVVEYEAGKVSC